MSSGTSPISCAALTGREDPKIKLSELIDILNDRFGTNFTQADHLSFDQIHEEAIESDALKKAAAANSKDDFRYVFEKAFEGLVIDHMEGNEEIFEKPWPMANSGS